MSHICMAAWKIWGNFALSQDLQNWPTSSIILVKFDFPMTGSHDWSLSEIPHPVLRSLLIHGGFCMETPDIATKEFHSKGPGAEKTWDVQHQELKGQNIMLKFIFRQWCGEMTVFSKLCPGDVKEFPFNYASVGVDLEFRSFFQWVILQMKGREDDRSIIHRSIKGCRPKVETPIWSLQITGKFSGLLPLMFSHYYYKLLLIFLLYLNCWGCGSEPTSSKAQNTGTSKPAKLRFRDQYSVGSDKPHSFSKQFSIDGHCSSLGAKQRDYMINIYKHSEISKRPWSMFPWTGIESQVSLFEFGPTLFSTNSWGSPFRNLDRTIVVTCYGIPIVTTSGAKCWVVEDMKCSPRGQRTYGIPTPQKSCLHSAWRRQMITRFAQRYQFAQEMRCRHKFGPPPFDKQMFE